MRSSRSFSLTFWLAFSLVLCPAVTTAQTQSAKPVVGILPMTTTSGDDADLYAARAYEGQLAQILGKVGRVSVLDRTQTSRVSAEKEQQKSSDFIDSRSIAAQGQSFGAQLVVAANVDKVALSQKATSDGSTYYECNLTVSVRVIDVATQEVKSSAVINTDASSGGKKGLGGMLSKVTTTHTTPQDALGAAVKNAEKDLTALFNTTWPVRFSIVQVESITPDSNSIVLLLDGGRALGASVKMVMTVMEATEMTVSGRTVTREKEIGRLEIASLEGDDLSTGVIKKDARVVAQRIAAGAKVYATIPR